MEAPDGIVTRRILAGPVRPERKCPARRPMEEAPCFRTRVKWRLAAGVAQWQSRSFPSLRRGFDSLHPLHHPPRCLPVPQRSPPASWRGSAATAAATCRGRARAIRTASGSRRSCCSRRRWRPRSRTSSGSWRAFPTSPRSPRLPRTRCMRLWSGLGYYARARNLHRAARAVVESHAGRFPLRVEEVEALPGIGRSTAAAIVAFATGERHAILDGNVKRVMARHFGVGRRRRFRARPFEVVGAGGVPGARDGRRALHAGADGPGGHALHAGQPRAARAVRCATTCVALREGRIAELPGTQGATPGARAFDRDARRGVARTRAGREAALAGHLGRVVEPARGARRCRPRRAGSRRPTACAWTRVDALEPFAHAFTHFRLAITPWRVRVKGVGDAGRANGPRPGSPCGRRPAPRCRRR